MGERSVHLPPEVIYRLNREKLEAVERIAAAEPNISHGWRHYGGHDYYIAISRHDRSGHFCGYVGVDVDHPLYGKTYSTEVKAPAKLLSRPVNGEKIGYINLFCAAASGREALKAGIIEVCMLFDVHGGLTYSEDHPPTQELQDACPKGLWWFGFDCAHAGDYSPFMERRSWSVLSDLKSQYVDDGVYRTFGYTLGETESLTRQLHDYRRLLASNWYAMPLFRLRMWCGAVKEKLWAKLPDKCSAPGCRGRGVRGNENRIPMKDGSYVLLCDDCHAEFDRENSKAGKRERNRDLLGVAATALETAAAALNAKQREQQEDDGL